MMKHSTPLDFEPALADLIESHFERGPGSGLQNDPAVQWVMFQLFMFL